MKKQIDIIKTEFTKQAPKFSEYQNTDDKTRFNLKAIEQMVLTGKETVLEVAAGTCAFGRMIAPHAKHITELDATEAMLSVGKSENEKAGIVNADYVIGTAEALPFADGSFDIVASRLAFHHFADAAAVFEEMCRALKPNGLLVIADMEARNEPYRERADVFETLRDPSHVKCLTEGEFKELAINNGLTVTHTLVTVIPMKLNSWMALTGVDSETKKKITCAMQADIEGGEKTGFFPYSNDGEIMFDHRWLLFICKKSNA